VAVVELTKLSTSGKGWALMMYTEGMEVRVVVDVLVEVCAVEAGDSAKEG
jgi:hypothetical protein